MYSLASRFALLMLLGLTTTLPAAAQPQMNRLAAAPRSTSGFDATYYHLFLNVSWNPARIDGHTRVEGRPVGGTLATLTLDLVANAGSTGEYRLRVDSVLTPNGEKLLFDQKPTTLDITLADPAAPGEHVAVDVYYGGVPAVSSVGVNDLTPPISILNGGSAMRPQRAFSLSEPYGGRVWWPSNDHPDDKADSVRVTISVPEGMIGASNGVLEQETVTDGVASFTWFERYPISTYLVSIAVAPYVVDRQEYVRPDSLARDLGPLTLPIVHYLYPGYEEWLGNWRIVTDVLPAFEYWFGAYPYPDEKYGHAQFDFSGGMEHQTLTSIGTANLGVVVHELGHQWFGDKVTTETWPHLWLNEGFATYSEYLYEENRRQRGLSNNADAKLADIYNRARAASGMLVVEDTLNVNNLFTYDRVYAKGAAVVHMLRGVLGDAAFRDVLLAYQHDPSLSYNNARTEDLQKVAEMVSGKNLDYFFEEWAYGVSYPEYTAKWTYGVSEEGGGEVQVLVEQPNLQRPIFTMPLDLEIVTEEGPVAATVLNDKRQQVFTIPVSTAPVALRFDPQNTVLHNAMVPVQRVYTSLKETPEAADVQGIVAVYPNPASAALTVAISLDPGTVSNLILYDLLGREVRRTEVSTYDLEKQVRFDVEDLGAGTYFLRLDPLYNVFDNYRGSRAENSLRLDARVTLVGR